MSVERANRAAFSDPGLAARIARLAESAGIVLDRHQLEQLAAYLNLLRRWNTTINLTSLDLENLPLSTVERLLLEPLTAATLIATTEGHWYDLGSGGGSPALPIKVARPDLALTMVESRGRKVAFLREAVRQMGLSDTEVCSTRIDELHTRPTKGIVQLITMRAVRIDADVVRAIRHMLSPSGEVVLFGADAAKLCAAGFTPIRSRNGITLLRSDVSRGTVAG